MTDTETKLIQALSRGLKLRSNITITPQSGIFSKGPDSLGLDSVDILEVAVILDKTFGVQLDDESEPTRAALQSIGSLATYIDAKKQSS